MLPTRRGHVRCGAPVLVSGPAADPVVLPCVRHRTHKCEHMDASSLHGRGLRAIERRRAKDGGVSTHDSRLKYSEEAFGYWFIFGEHADGTVDVVTETGPFDGEIALRVPRAVAETVCQHHNAMIVAAWEGCAGSQARRDRAVAAYARSVAEQNERSTDVG